jgi:hypothetical protein
MVSFGGNQFINCSVPLAFEGRYFIIEQSGQDPLISVVLEHKGKPVFEVRKNLPVENVFSDVSKSPAGIVTVIDHTSRRFLYKVRPGSATSVVFGTIAGQEVTASVTDRKINVGGLVVKNGLFDGVGAGVVVDKNGTIGIGAPVPQGLINLIRQLNNYLLSN